MTAIGHRIRSAGLAGAALALAAALTTWPTALAASPSPPPPSDAPSAAPSPGGSAALVATPAPLPTGDLVIGHGWLDAPLPADAPPGSAITVGVLAVTGDSGSPSLAGSLRMRLYPATGTAPPSLASAVTDWRGHYVGTITVPEGGVGRLTVGQPGRFCNDSGCVDSDLLFDPLVVGPPSGVPLPLIATAVVIPPSSMTAGQPVTFEVDITPRVEWPDPGLGLPDQLILEVRMARGPVVEELAIRNSAAEPRRYAGTLTLDDAGDYVVQPATAMNPAESELFGAAIVPVTVDPGSPVVPPASDGGLPDWWPAAAAGLALVLAAVLILRDRGAPAR